MNEYQQLGIVILMEKTAPNPKTRKAANIIVAAVGIILVLIVFASCMSPKKDEPEPVASPTVEAIQAEQVKDAWLTAHLIDEPIELLTREGSTLDESNPIYAINGWENVNSTAIEVHVQETLTKESAERVAVNVFHLTWDDAPNLETIYVVGVDGVEHITDREDTPMGRNQG